jgi:type I restriction enzyme S subunit
MNADDLLAHYHRIADAPDAIPRLRRFILDLAVRGKLVPQDPKDEPVSQQLAQLKVARATEKPFTLPSTWAWVTVGSVATARLGKMLDKAKNRGTLRPYLRNTNVRWFDFDLSDLYEMAFEESELVEFGLLNGDVLICEGGEPGRAAVWDERQPGIYFQKAIHRVRFYRLVEPNFFVNALRTSAQDGRLLEYFTGTGIKHFTGQSLDSYVFPLPPLAEQHRIVAKVDELMALCDRLEVARAEREAARDRLAAASLARLNAPAPDPAAFANDARFALTNLTALTTRHDQVKQLRQTILNLVACVIAYDGQV